MYTTHAVFFFSFCHRWWAHSLIAIKPYQGAASNYYAHFTKALSQIGIIYRLGFTIRFNFNENRRSARISLSFSAASFRNMMSCNVDRILHRILIVFFSLSLSGFNVNINCDPFACLSASKCLRLPHFRFRRYVFFLFAAAFFPVLSVYWCLTVIKTIPLTSESNSIVNSRAASVFPHILGSLRLSISMLKIFSVYALCKRTLNGFLHRSQADVTLNWHRFQLRFASCFKFTCSLFYALQMRIHNRITLTKGNLKAANDNMKEEETMWNRGASGNREQ